MGAVYDIRSGEAIACASNFTETAEQQINRRVLALMKGKARGDTIGKAQLQAKRIYRDENTTIGQAIQRGIVWAVCEDEPNPPRPAA
jgi:hypothetical protein